VPTIPAARPLARFLIAAGIVLVPWLIYLACTLPAASAPAWTALDALEATGLITTGLLLRRGDPRLTPAALATALLLVTDAYADITTAASASDLTSAITMAVLAELPTATLCTALALHHLRGARLCSSAAPPRGASTTTPRSALNAA
jgi:hypothetical protein